MAKPYALPLTLPNGLQLQVQVSHSRRKHVGIYVSAQGVEVRSPHGVPAGAIAHMLEGKLPWLMSHLPLLTFEPPQMLPHALCWYRGQQHTLLELLPHLPASSWQHAATIAKALRQWYGQQAQLHLGALLEVYSQTAAEKTAFAIGDQKRRWGSCNSLGHIRLNWRAVMLPPELAAYLVAHEVAHRTHMHHQPAFWQEVARMMPDWKSRHQALHQWDIWLSWRL